MASAFCWEPSVSRGMDLKESWADDCRGSSGWGFRARVAADLGVKSYFIPRGGHLTDATPAWFHCCKGDSLKGQLWNLDAAGKGSALRGFLTTTTTFAAPMCEWAWPWEPTGKAEGCHCLLDCCLLVGVQSISVSRCVMATDTRGCVITIVNFSSVPH